MFGQLDAARVGTPPAVAVQPVLPGVADVSPRIYRTRTRRADAASTGTNDPLLAVYLRRLAARGAAQKGFAAYRYQLRVLLDNAARRTGYPVSLAALFRNPQLLGAALVDDRVAHGGQQLSRWTLAQRRSAVRSFATLAHPELAALSIDAHTVLDHALRGVAERVGTGFRLTGGTPRKRGGYAPTPEDVAAVIASAGSAPGFVGPRNAVFLGILAESGARVNALRELDGADCAMLPSGRIRLFLHAKGKEEAREVELSRAHADALRQYVEAFNRHAATRGWRTRIRLGETGAVWRNGPRGRWSYDGIVSTLRDGCTAAGIAPFEPHALRRAFASNAASTVPRHTVALAGGWHGLERLDDHYVRTRDATIAAKLQFAGTANISDVPAPDGITLTSAANTAG